MDYNIALIGAGQLGSRHLQGLKKINIPINIEIVDPNHESLKIAKERYLEIEKNDQIKSIRFINSIDDLNSNIDLCIISTNANIRASIAEQIIIAKQIKYIVFEKFLFQKTSDYSHINGLLEKYKIKAWVNCPRRIFPDYIKLKEHLSPNPKLTFTISGGEWGMACNSIHFLDLVAFFNNDYNIKFETNLLDNEIRKSKRDGYVEFTGMLIGHQDNGSKIIINSLADSTAPHIITINNQHCSVIIDETNQCINISSYENNWKWEKAPVNILFQSQLSGIIAKDILTTGTCGLTSFDNSLKIHESFLMCMLKIYNKKNSIQSDILPIT